MLAHVTSSELTDWMAYDLIEPIGDRPTQELLAALLAFQVNSARAQNKKKPLPLDDFMPGIGPDPKERARDEFTVLSASLTAAGKVWEAKQKADA